MSNPDGPDISRPPSTAPGDVPGWAKGTVKTLRGVWYVLSALLAVTTLFNAVFPNAIPNLFNLRDVLFDGPTALRQSTALQAREAETNGAAPTFSQGSTDSGFVYYEASVTGKMTDDGRFLIYKVAEPLPPFNQIAPATVLQAQGTVRLRAEATSNSQLLGLITALECVVVTSDQSKQVPTSAGSTGGWIPVSRTVCP